MGTERTTILLIGTLDTKGEEYAFMAERIRAHGCSTLVMDTGVLGGPSFRPDISSREVAEAAGADLDLLRSAHDRGEAVAAMGRGAEKCAGELYEQGRFHGIIALGGGGGTSVACAAMRPLPVGVPKVMISTLAGGDVSGYLGVSDIVMIPSLVDPSGLNRMTRGVISRAAAAVCAMASAAEGGTQTGDTCKQPLIAATMFGNTTPAVAEARRVLEKNGCEVVTFPCSGTSGRVMERLIRSGLVNGVLDLTTTEWADQLAGGVLAAGEERLNGAAETGVPQVVAPGCLDMVNFHEPETVPARYKPRLFYQHNPNITLMRTDPEENRQLGEIIAGKLNKSAGPCALFLPLKGLSMIDAPGGPFWMPEADLALFDSLKRNLAPGVEVHEMDCNINDPEFARACAEKLLDFLARAG